MRSFLGSVPRGRAGVFIAGAGMVATFVACTSTPAKGPVAAPPSPGLSIQNVPSTPPIALPSKSPASTLPGVRASACRSGDPLRNVYHPYRLHIRSACRTVTGVVTSIRTEPDGDYHINVRLDAKYAGLINDRNRTGEGGNLVVEVVPADEPGCTPGKPPRPPYDTYDFGVCTGADIAAPPTGAHISVTGPYVLDANHGWMEIHPVWRLSVLSSSGSTVPPKPASSVRITSISPNPVNPGQNITLIAQTSAGASCSIRVTYASGTVSQAQGLYTKNASSSGRVSWTWKVGTRTGAGNATARVSCGSRSASASFRVT